MNRREYDEYVAEKGRELDASVPRVKCWILNANDVNNYHPEAIHLDWVDMHGVPLVVVIRAQVNVDGEQLNIETINRIEMIESLGDDWVGYTRDQIANGIANALTERQPVGFISKAELELLRDGGEVEKATE